MVAPAEVPALRERLPIVSTRLVGGRTEIRVVGAERPDSLDPAEPTLEDVYFATLAAARHRRGVAGVAPVFTEIFRFECRQQLGSPLFIAIALMLLRVRVPGHGERTGEHRRRRTTT